MRRVQNDFNNLKLSQYFRDALIIIYSVFFDPFSKDLVLVKNWRLLNFNLNLVFFLTESLGGLRFERGMIP